MLTVGNCRLRFAPNAMKRLLTLTAVIEAATGVALIVVPSLVGRLLLGTELTGVASPVARVAGIALISLGVACLPNSTAFRGMLTYSLLATLYLFYLAIRGEWVGPLLWPAVVLHAVLTVSLIYIRVAGRTDGRGMILPHD
jgi:hypothetical protein